MCKQSQACTDQHAVLTRGCTLLARGIGPDRHFELWTKKDVTNPEQFIVLWSIDHCDFDVFVPKPYGADYR